MNFFFDSCEVSNVDVKMCVKKTVKYKTDQSYDNKVDCVYTKTRTLYSLVPKLEIKTSKYDMNYRRKLEKKIIPELNGYHQYHQQLDFYLLHDQCCVSLYDKKNISQVMNLKYTQH